VLQKAELSGDADSENNPGGSSIPYVLHRLGHSQEGDQLLRQGRRWSCADGGQDWLHKTTTGRLGPRSTTTAADRHGSDGFYGMDL